MANIDDLTRALHELNQKYPRPGLPDLDWSKPYDLKVDWPREWPNSGEPGVYAIFGPDPSRELLYIGKVSCGATIGGRLGAHFRYANDRSASVRHAHWNAVQYVVTLGVSPEHAFEAPAIEEFLIGRLSPPLNVMGVTA